MRLKKTLLALLASALIGCGGSGGSSSSDDDPIPPPPVTITWLTQPLDSIENQGMDVEIRAARTANPEFEVNYNEMGNKTFMWWKLTSSSTWSNEIPSWPGDLYHIYLKATFNPWDMTIECERMLDPSHSLAAGEYNLRASVERYDSIKTYSPAVICKRYYHNLNARTKLDQIITDNLAANPKYGGHSMNTDINGVTVDARIVWDGEAVAIEYVEENTIYGGTELLGAKKAACDAAGVKCSEFRASTSESELISKLLEAVDDDLQGSDTDGDGNGVGGQY